MLHQLACQQRKISSFSCSAPKPFLILDVHYHDRGPRSKFLQYGNVMEETMQLFPVFLGENHIFMNTSTIGIMHKMLDLMRFDKMYR